MGGEDATAPELVPSERSRPAMCFNLFGSLVGDLGLATVFLESLQIPGGIREVTDVRVEFAPTPRSAYLDNGSSFDAFVAYIDGDGERAFLGVETKLTEPFTQSGGSSQRAEPHYVALTERLGSVWREDAWPHARICGGGNCGRTTCLSRRCGAIPKRPSALGAGSSSSVTLRTSNVLGHPRPIGGRWLCRRSPTSICRSTLWCRSGAGRLPATGIAVGSSSSTVAISISCGSAIGDVG